MVIAGEVDGIAIEPHGMCVDDRGRLFVADGSNSRILVLNSQTGSLVQLIHLRNLGDIYELGFFSNNAQLLIQHSTTGSDKEQISIFNISYF